MPPVNPTDSIITRSHPNQTRSINLISTQFKIPLKPALHDLLCHFSDKSRLESWTLEKTQAFPSHVYCSVFFPQRREIFAASGKNLGGFQGNTKSWANAEKCQLPAVCSSWGRLTPIKGDKLLFRLDPHPLNSICLASSQTKPR